MRNTICATLTAITLTLCTALAGCGSASEPAAPGHAVRSIESQCSAWRDDLRECVVYSGYQNGGLSCDWSHVSGADREPDR